MIAEAAGITTASARSRGKSLIRQLLAGSAAAGKVLPRKLSDWFTTVQGGKGDAHQKSGKNRYFLNLARTVLYLLHPKQSRMRRVRILVSAARLPEKNFVTRSHPETQKARDPWSVRGPFLLRAARGMTLATQSKAMAARRIGD